MLGQRELNLEDYLAILRRRLWVIVPPVVVGTVIGFGVSLLFPSRYTSKSLILVQQQKVPDSFVQSVVTDDLAFRLATMQKQILSQPRLQQMIQRFGLLKEDAGRKPMEVLVLQLQKALSVDSRLHQMIGRFGLLKEDPGRKPMEVVQLQKAISVDNAGFAASDDSGGSVPGFNISVALTNPRLAQQICQEITSLFIEENNRIREQSARGTTTFLDAQLAEAKRNLDEQDTKMAEFKAKHMDEMPDDIQTNLSVLESLNGELESATQALNRAQQDKAYVRSLLAQQLAAWRASTKANNSRPELLQDQLDGMEKELVDLQTRYTSDYPDVVRLRTAIQQLRKKISDAEAAGNARPIDKVERASRPPEKTEKSSPDEPAEIQQLRSQLRDAELAIQDAKHEQAKLQHRVSLYRSRVHLSPALEQQYKRLTRDYDTALGFYNELLAKRKQSAMTTDLERRRQGEQFRILIQPDLPELPSFPNTRLFVAGGLAVGLGLGMSLALLLEMLDKSLRDERDVDFFLKLPTLVMLPTIEYEPGRSRGRQVRETR